MTKIHKPDFSRGKPKHQEFDAIERAERMIPALRQNAQLARELRRVPDETREMLRASGLARILQPRRVGGSEMPLVSLLDVLLPIGAGCGSTAWVLAQYLIHNYMIARWPEEAQEKICRGRTPLSAASWCHCTGKRIEPRMVICCPVIGRLSAASHETDWCILSATTTA